MARASRAITAGKFDFLEEFCAASLTTSIVGSEAPPKGEIEKYGVLSQASLSTLEARQHSRIGAALSNCWRIRHAHCSLQGSG